MTEQATLEACLCLVILGEVALFGGPCWVILADHVSATGSDVLRHRCLSSQFHAAAYDGGGNGWANSLTLLNSNILFGSGVLSVGLAHRLAAGAHCSAGVLVVSVVVVGSLFIAVQCVEYAHLHTTVTTGGVSGVFYVLTCLHGFHVVVGLLAVVLHVAMFYCVLAVSTLFALCEYGSSAGSLAVLAY